jgi:type IV secretion system protein VirB10
MMVTAPPSGDPRTASEANVLPVVAQPRSGPPVWTIVLGVAFAGLLLFFALDARRRSLSAPAVRPLSRDLVTSAGPPPALYVPPEPAPPLSAPPVAIVQPIPVQRPQSPAPPQVVYVPQPQPAPAPAFTPPPPQRTTGEPALVIDTTGPAQQPGPNAQGPQIPVLPPGSANSIAGARAGAGVLANRATTVQQGTLIPAVLETALDSTRPGLARAVVSRDVRGFDGSRVLIPRGSRLIGEYRSDAEAGQNRMLVNWIRLVRPDGATIAIGSPAGDTLGRGGIRASVNSHFFERFAGAILQSALDVGVNLASRSVDSSVVVLPSGGLQGGVTRIPNQVRPTLRVKAATSISIFVARDLDFTGVEAR